MSHWQAKRGCAALTQFQLAYLSQDNEGLPTEFSAANPASTLESTQWSGLPAALETLVEAHRPHRLNVIVANDVARHWFMDAPPAVRSLRELKSFTYATFEQIYGVPSEDWVITADWHLHRPYLCAAIPRPVSRALEHGGNRHGIRLRINTFPGLLLGHAHALLANGSWTCVFTPQSLTLLHGSQGHLTGIRTFNLPVSQPCDEQDLGSQAARLIRREAAKQETEAPHEATWLHFSEIETGGGNEPETLHEGIRFHRKRISLPALPNGTIQLSEAAHLAVVVAHLTGRSA